LFVSEAKSQVTHFWAISWVLNEAEIALWYRWKRTNTILHIQGKTI
jgi:hypothetical protein